MTDSDGVEEAFEGQLRMAVTSAARYAEQMERAREDARRRAAQRSEQESGELTSRLEAERVAARAAYQPTQSQQWWEQADAERIGAAYQSARAWSSEDAEAARAAAHMRDEISRRYGVDVDGQDAQQVRDRIAEREAQTRQQAERAEAAMHITEATAAEVEEQRHREAAEFEPDLADRAAAHERAQQEADRAGSAQAAAEVSYDSAERREADAARLRSQGIDERSVDARMRADVSQGRPAHEAVEHARRAPKKAAARGTSQPQRQRSGLSR